LRLISGSATEWFDSEDYNSIRVAFRLLWLAFSEWNWHLEQKDAKSRNNFIGF
jgi:hypothetical protein